ncbi:MAG TPA: hypothetical protein VK422_05995 [Pyrinomonadaceae bacterium]|nr:hypothetical protein [Pyrinomonadaceae bacterium]
MAADWQLSAADISEALWPAALLASALASIWVLHDAGRVFKSYAPPLALACALLTLLLPPVFLPLYLAWRLFARKDTKDGEGGEPHARPRRLKGLALPLAYGVAVFAVGGFFFVRDYRSFEARLARARLATHHGRHDRAVAEYRAALRLRDDAHTRKLLGMELLKVGRREEGLAELREAARAGEPGVPLEGEVAP